MSEKVDLIRKTVELELEMFLSVPTVGKYSCQEQPDSFRLHRRAQFIAWSEDTIRSYFDDLRRAKEKGINLLTIKYARMDDLIPRENQNPLIEKIAALQYKWQQEMFTKYPNLMARARPLSESDDSAFKTSFITYMKGELETYSDNTLSLLYRDIMEKLKASINMSEETYDYLVQELGYSSIGDAEIAQKRKREE